MDNRINLHSLLPIIGWLRGYPLQYLRWDLVAGVTLASFVLPESMAYATLAGLPPYFGIYCCIAGSLFFALFTTSRQVAVGPTSSISLMVGTTVAVLSGGDPQRWIGIAALTALVVAGICFVAYIFKLSSLVNFISDSILLGFKAGAALSIMSTQLPKLFGVEGGGGNFFLRIGNLVPHLPGTNWVVFGLGIAALLLLIAGDVFFPGRPVSLFVVVLAILAVTFFDLHAHGVHVAGAIPGGLPEIRRPSLRLRDIDGVLDLAFACFLMGYIETVSAGRTLAMRNNYVIQPRQELLSLGAANLATAFSSGYVVAGGLSQSIVNDKSGAKSPLSLIICSITLIVILLFLTGLLKNLPEVVLAVIVLHAVAGLIKIRELKRIYQLNREEFIVAMIAVGGVLVLGILKGVMLAVIMSLVLLIRRVAHPEVSILGRIGDTVNYSDIARHPENVQVNGVIIFRIESSILYFNAGNIIDKLESAIAGYKSPLKMVILDLSATPYIDVAGSGMLLRFCEQLNKNGIQLRIADALSNVRDLLRIQGMEKLMGRPIRRETIDDIIKDVNPQILNP